MSTARLLIAMIVAFILMAGLGTLIHAFLLASDYNTVATLYRPAASTLFPLIFLAYAAYAIAFVWIYSKGVEDKPPVMQGLTFGFLAWLLAKLPPFVIVYAVQPMPSILLLKQLGYELIAALILGTVVSMIVRKT
ncbi:MAG TPA: hypothetical protein VN934_05455 [Candidatus Tumulicola sp.]|nr:hypothetical protein [Candidatus Tumulicola sp.]